MDNQRQNRGPGGNRGGKPAGKPGFGGNRPANSASRGKGGPRPAGKAPFRGNPAAKKPYSPANRGTRPAPAGQGKPARPVPEGMPARRLALSVIRAVTENGAYANQALDAKLSNCGLPQVDRRLAARLVYDTLEHLLTIDWVLAQVMARPDTDMKLRNILRLGACQILYEDRIPESAATNTAVTLCRELDMEGLVGVCNGILRSLVRMKEHLKWPDPETEPVKALSVKHSVPEWLVERLVADWGERAEGLMSWHEEETSVTVRPNLTRHDDASFEALLAGKVWEHEKADVPFAWRVRHMADIGRDAGFVGGDFSIQSESSMMACLAVGPKRGWQVLDACAAPGGKACLLAELMGGTGRVQAWELHEHRTALIAAQAKRLGLDNIRPMTRDAVRHRPDYIESMDAVLLDAPCSGLGVMAGKPDVKYRVTEQSVRELTELQRSLLDAVAPYVKRGGVLVYSTCSVLEDENVRQIEAFLGRHPEFELAQLPETIPERFRQHADVGLQLLPDRDGVEGFYICRLRRKRL